MPEKNQWNEWSNFVLNELKRLNECQEHIKDDITQIKVDIAMLKVKSGAWGAAAGGITVGITILIQYLA